MSFLGPGYTELWLPLLAYSLPCWLRWSKTPCWRGPYGNELMAAPGQQLSRNNLTNNHMSLGADSSPFKTPDKNPIPGQHFDYSPVTDLKQRIHLSHAQNLYLHKLCNNKYVLSEAAKFVIICYSTINNTMSSSWYIWKYLRMK